jgi:hypothetical protein
MKSRYLSVPLVAMLILAAAASRIVNAELHLWNFAPVAALGLFGGAVLQDKRWAFLLPLLAQFVADAYFQLFTSTPGFYDMSQFFVYGGMALVTLLGTKMGEPKVARVAGFALSGSLIFFIVSNFGVFLTGMYGTGVSALTKTYAMAVPFYQPTLVGDLLFSALFFGVYALVQRRAEVAPARA